MQPPHALEHPGRGQLFDLGAVEEATGKAERPLGMAALAERARFRPGSDLLDEDVGRAPQMQQRVQQAGAVAVGEHRAAAVEPARILRAGIPVARAGRGGDSSHAQRHALVSLPGANNGVDGQEPDGLGQLPGRRGAHVLRQASRAQAWQCAGLCHGRDSCSGHG